MTTLEQLWSSAVLIRRFPLGAVFLLSLFLGEQQIFAAQEYRVGDGDTVTVQISSNDLTRIAMAGTAKITYAWNSDVDMEVQVNEEHGFLFVRPKSSARGAMSFFVRDDSGSTYTLVATQHDIPAETILLKPKMVRTPPDRAEIYRTDPLVDKVKRLVKGMALDQTLEEYEAQNASKEVALWQEARIGLAKRYVGLELQGEVYILTNVSDAVMRVEEREFFAMGTGVQAVAIERLELAPSDVTRLFVVRRFSGEVTGEAQQP